MIKQSVTWVLLFIGILLLLGGPILGNSVIGELMESYGSYSADRVVVSVTKDAAKDGSNLFTIDDLESLAEQPGIGETAAEAESAGMIKFGDKTATAVICGVTYNYASFIDLDIINGSFITKSDEDEANQTVVIGEELALELFGTLNATGNKIEIYGRTFTVTGVVKKDNSILGVLTDSKDHRVYIPAGVMLESDNTAGITSIRTRTQGEELLGRNEDIVSNALGNIGKNALKYIIEDYGSKTFYLRQKILLAVFIPGLILILTLAVLLKKLIKKLITEISSSMKTDYLSNILKTQKKLLLSYSARILILTAGMFAVWYGIKFRLFIPQSYIPGDLTDLSFYWDLAKGLIRQNNSMTGYLPPFEDILLGKAREMLDRIFYSSVLAGILLTYIGLYQLKMRNTGLSTTALASTLIVAATVAISSLAVILSGMPLFLGTKGLLVLYTFVFINSILISKERDEVFKC